MARCGKLTGTILPDCAFCSDCESYVVGDCISMQIERAYQGKQGVNAVSGRSLLFYKQMFLTNPLKTNIFATE